MGKALFRNACQRGLLTIFSSAGANPLTLWEVHMQNGYYKQHMDPQLKSMVFDICGTNVSTAYMVCPKKNNVLGIVMPYLVMIVKNLHKYWSFEITILDGENVRRRFRASNFQSTTQINLMNTAMPICLADGWNQIQFNLADFTHRAYAKRFAEVLTVKINANICIRRIYFAERLMPDDELPREYKLYFPLSRKPQKGITNGAGDKIIPRPSRETIAKEPQEAIKRTSQTAIAPQETVEKASEATNETQETMKKASESNLVELKDASHSKKSATSNLSVQVSTQPEVTSKHSNESQHLGIEPNASKHSGSQTVEIAQVEPGGNNENDPGNIQPEPGGFTAEDLSSSPKTLEVVPEENEE